MAYKFNMKLGRMLVIVASTYCINQIIWLIIAWISVFLFIKISGFHLFHWGYIHPGYIIFWNFFNDFIPYLITSYRQNFNPKVDYGTWGLVGALVTYGIVGFYLAWKWRWNPHLNGLNYPILSLMVFGARALMIWNLCLKFKIKHGLDSMINKSNK